MKSRIVLACLAAAACLALGFALTRTNHAAPEDKPVKSDKAANQEEPVNHKADSEEEAIRKAAKEEEAAINKAFAAYVAAYAKGDVVVVLSMWTADAEFIDEDGRVHHGRDALAPMFSKSLPSFKGYKITGKLTSVRFVKPDVALVDGELTFVPPQGETDVSRFTSVWVKVDGHWRIRNARDLTPEPTGETVASRRLRELDWLVGEWVSEGTDSTVHLKVSWGLNKSFLVWEYEVKRKQGSSSKVIKMMGWDPLTQQIRTWVFDDQGGYGTALWRRNGNAWTSEAIGVLPDGTTGSAFNTVKYQDDKTFMWHSQHRETDGQPLPDLEAKFTRPAPKP